MSAQQPLLGTGSPKQAKLWQRAQVGPLGPTMTKYILTQCNQYHHCCYTGHHKQSNLQGAGSISAARYSITPAAHVLAGSDLREVVPRAACLNVSEGLVHICLITLHSVLDRHQFCRGAAYAVED